MLINLEQFLLFLVDGWLTLWKSAPPSSEIVEGIYFSIFYFISSYGKLALAKLELHTLDIVFKRRGEFSQIKMFILKKKTVHTT